MQNPKSQLPTAATDIDSIVIPIEDQTTVRVSKELHDKLVLISVLEKRTLISIMQSVLGDYCRRYESATGRTLSPSKVKAPRS